MVLNKTIILPGDNFELSKRLMTSILIEEDVVAIVIFGKDAKAEDAVKKADLRAAKTVAGIERKVMWMQDAAQLSFLKTLINDSDTLSVENIDLKKHIGIAISLTDILRDLLPIKPAPDFLKMEASFIKASII